jgi:type IV secretory pathway VirB6-like protein
MKKILYFILIALNWHIITSNALFALTNASELTDNQKSFLALHRNSKCPVTIPGSSTEITDVFPHFNLGSIILNIQQSVTAMALLSNWAASGGSIPEHRVISQFTEDYARNYGPYLIVEQAVSIAPNLPYFFWQGAQIMDGFRRKGIADCNQDRTNEVISFCYNPLVETLQPHRLDGTCQPQSFTDNSAALINGQWFYSIRINRSICIQTLTPVGAVTLACQDINRRTVNQGKTDSCYVSTRCTVDAINNSGLKSPTKSFFPMSGALVLCVKETLEKLFQNPILDCNDGGTRTNLFFNFQNYMRQGIFAALILYVIFFGGKIILTKSVPKGYELFIFLLKLSLVFFFSLGTFFQTEIYPIFLNVSSGLSDIVFRSGGASGLCDFHPSSYPSGFGFMSLWDALDCRIGYYLGLYNINTTIVGGGMGALILGASLSIVGIPLALLWMVQLLPLIFILLFAIFFLSVAIYAVQTFLMAMMMTTIMAVLAPLFVPMALFKQTKGYFDAWWRMFFSYMVQPLLVFGFLAFTMTVIDSAYYGKCKFVKTELGGGIVNYLIDDNSSNYSGRDYQQCKETFGYQMFNIKRAEATYDEKGNLISAQAIKSEGNYFINIFKLDENYWKMTGNMLVNLFHLTLMMFLFYHFVAVLQNLATDISGASSPQAAASKQDKKFHSSTSFLGDIGKKFDTGRDAMLGAAFGKKKK